MDREKILQALYQAIDEVNLFRAQDQRLEKAEGTLLLGKDGRLDSLAMVNFIVAAEMNLGEAFGVELNLADDRAMALGDSPFRTVGTLAGYIALRLEEKLDGQRKS